jgi:hypothetical protein
MLPRTINPGPGPVGHVESGAVAETGANRSIVAVAFAQIEQSREGPA